jgi:hypothetical protein
VVEVNRTFWLFIGLLIGGLLAIFISAIGEVTGW